MFLSTHIRRVVSTVVILSLLSVSTFSACSRKAEPPPPENNTQAYERLRARLAELADKGALPEGFGNLDVATSSCSDILKGSELDAFRQDIERLKSFKWEADERLADIDDALGPIARIEERINAAIRQGTMPSPLSPAEQSSVEATNSAIVALHQSAEAIRGDLNKLIEQVAPGVMSAAEFLDDLAKTCKSAESTLSDADRQRLKSRLELAVAKIQSLEPEGDGNLSSVIERLEQEYSKFKEHVQEFNSAWEASKHLFPEGVQKDVDHDRTFIDKLVEAIDTAIEFVSDVLVAWGVLAVLGVPAPIALIIAFIGVALDWWSNSPGFEAKKPSKNAESPDGDESGDGLPGDPKTESKQPMPRDSSERKSGDKDAGLGGTPAGKVIFEDFFRGDVFYLHVLYPDSKTFLLGMDPSKYDGDSQKDARLVVNAIQEIAAGKRRGNVKSISEIADYPIAVTISGIGGDGGPVRLIWKSKDQLDPEIAGGS